MADSNGYWQRFTRARVSRRRAIGGALSLTAATAALALVGCESDGKSSTGDTSPRRGGILRTGTTLPLSAGLDPHIETATGLGIFPRVYGYMLHVDPRDDSVSYDHASSVEQPDPLTYIIKLRSDVRFQDVAPANGRAVMSEDVAASILRYRDHQLVTSKTWHTTVLDRVETPDPSTVKVVLKRPYVYTLQELGAIGAGAIIPREAIASGQNLSTQGAGSGPFRIDRASLAEGASILRNETYYRSPIPYLDEMDWSVHTSDKEKIAALERRDLDVVPVSDRSEADTLRASPGKFDVTSEPSLSYLSLGIRSDRPPLADPRVRGAIDVALDRDALIRDIGLGDGDILGPVNPHLAGGFWSLPHAEVVEAHRGTAAIEDRRAGARAILAASGASSIAFTLQVASVPQLIDVATVIRDQLQRVGFQITLQELDLLAWYNSLRRGEFEATLISHLPYETPDTPTRYYHSAGPDGTGNPFGYADGTLDALVERSWGEPNRDARRDSLLVAQRIMLYGRPMLQLFSGYGYSAAAPYVRNRRPELPGSLAQYNYEQWLAPTDA